jgi:4-hydroxy-tetrahydrodipicolinate reductase
VAYRLIQWGTGNVGRHALRTILERPDFELVGVRVYNPDKVGHDAGVLLGGAPVGVLATDDVEAILALDADCVCYAPLGTTLDDYTQPLDDLCRLLASGKNVVSSAVEYYAYLQPGIAPNRTGDAHERLAAACAAGTSSFYHVGINPGFTMDQWPITLSRVCRRIDRITAVELVDMQRYPSMQIVRDYIGFGLPPDVETPLDRQLADVRESAFYLSMRMIADALHVELDDVVYHRDVALTDTPITIAAGVIEAGTVAAMTMHLDGIRDGDVLIALEWVWRVSDEVAPDWPRGDSRWLVTIDGDPRVESELLLSTTEDAGRATSLAVASLMLNAVPAVCAAPPGILDNLTVAPHGGGYFLARDEGRGS